MKMIGDTKRFSCCDYCDSKRAPNARTKAKRMWKRAERAVWKREVQREE